MCCIRTHRLRHLQVGFLSFYVPTFCIARSRFPLLFKLLVPVYSGQSCLLHLSLIFGSDLLTRHWGSSDPTSSSHPSLGDFSGHHPPPSREASDDSGGELLESSFMETDLCLSKNGSNTYFLPYSSTVSVISHQNLHYWFELGRTRPVS